MTEENDTPPASDPESQKASLASHVGAETLAPDSTSPVETIRAGVGVEILAAKFLEQLAQSTQSYLEMLGLNESMTQFNFKEIFIEALKKLIGIETQGVDFEKIYTPIYSHPLFYKILEQGVQICTQRMIGSCKSGNFGTGLQYLILAHECARITNHPLPKEIKEHFSIISSSATRVTDGSFKQFFSRTSTLLLFVPRDDSKPISHDREELPLRYERFLALLKGDKSLIKKIFLDNLIFYANQAKEKNDFASQILFQRENGT